MYGRCRIKGKQAVSSSQNVLFLYRLTLAVRYGNIIIVTLKNWAAQAELAPFLRLKFD